MFVGVAAPGEMAEDADILIDSISGLAGRYSFARFSSVRFSLFWRGFNL